MVPTTIAATTSSSAVTDAWVKNMRFPGFVAPQLGQAALRRRTWRPQERQGTTSPLWVGPIAMMLMACPQPGHRDATLRTV